MAVKIKLFKDQDPQGVWVDYRDGARVKIRPLTGSVVRDLRARASTMRREWIAGRLRETTRVDEAAYWRLVADHLIEDWEGFQDPEGKDIPCTPQTKVLMLDQVLDFAGFVTEAAANIQDYLIKQEEELTQNLSGTSAGKKASRRTAKPAA